MKFAHVAGIVTGAVLLVVALVLVVGGLGLAALASERDANGYLEADLARLETATYAFTTDELDLGTDAQFPTWLGDEVSLRIAITGDSPVFVGIGPAGDVERYLGDVAREEVTDISEAGVASVRHEGSIEPAPPGDQPFWAASASGAGRQELVWEPEPGRWSIVVMNADASAGVVADASVGARVGFLRPLSNILLVLGFAAFLLGVGLIWLSVSRSRRSPASVGPALHPGTPLPPPPPAAPPPPQHPPSAPPPPPGGSGWSSPS